MAEEIRQEIQKSAQEADLVLVGIGSFKRKKLFFTDGKHG